MSDGEMEEKELIYLCTLSRIFLFKPSLVNGILTAGLLNDIFEGPAALLRELFCGDKEAAEKIRDPALLEQTAADLRWMRGKEVSVLEITNERYPRLLKECPDAPPVLYYIGKAGLNPARSISMVGTRLASCYGKESCRNLADYFAKNGYRPMIVSGLAYGIDINVHRSALEFGMETVGVLPCGIDRIYPALHRDTAVRMTASGGIITEFPRGTPPLKINFIKRNRIIAGLTQGLVVVESRIKGGAMSTVEFACGYGRDVFAVPGRMGDVNSYGCNYLISKNIARICNHPSVIPEALNWQTEEFVEIKGQRELFSSQEKEKEKILLSLSDNSGTDVDAICSKTGLPLETVAVILLELELEGRIVPVRGNSYCLRR